MWDFKFHKHIRREKNTDKYMDANSNAELKWKKNAKKKETKKKQMNINITEELFVLNIFVFIY